VLVIISKKFRTVKGARFPILRLTNIIHKWFEIC